MGEGNLEMSSWKSNALRRYIVIPNRGGKAGIARPSARGLCFYHPPDKSGSSGGLTPAELDVVRLRASLRRKNVLRASDALLGACLCVACLALVGRAAFGPHLPQPLPLPRRRKRKELPSEFRFPTCQNGYESATQFGGWQGRPAGRPTAPTACGHYQIRTIC